MMRTKPTPGALRVALVVALLVVAMGMALPGFGAAITSDASHTWVTQADVGNLFPPPPPKSESDAMVLAATALGNPSSQLLAQANSGDTRAIAQIKLMSRLKDSKPRMIGREVMLVGSGKGLKVLIASDGGMRMIELKKTMGPDGVMPHSPTDLQAIANVNSLAEVVRALSPNALPANMNAYVTGYHVGFAGPDGSHIVVVVGPGGITSIEQDIP
jgi:hypothetical protein